MASGRYVPDGIDKVTGRAQYGADLQLTGLLHAKVLRSPVCPRSNQVDRHQRRRSPPRGSGGGHRERTCRSTFWDRRAWAATTSGLKFASDNYLAGDKALYKGHAVAAVAAVNPHVAEEALGLIKVEYEELDAGDERCGTP